MMSRMAVERITIDKLRDWRAEPGSTAITIELWPHHWRRGCALRGASDLDIIALLKCARPSR
jgi:hypothetical protein